MYAILASCAPSGENVPPPLPTTRDYQLWQKILLRSLVSLSQQGGRRGGEEEKNVIARIIFCQSCIHYTHGCCWRFAGPRAVQVNPMDVSAQQEGVLLMRAPSQATQAFSS